MKKRNLLQCAQTNVEGYGLSNVSMTEKKIVGGLSGRHCISA